VVFRKICRDLPQLVPLQQKLAATTSLKVVFARMKIAADRIIDSTDAS
jgi:hypothetical protein